MNNLHDNNENFLKYFTLKKVLTLNDITSALKCSRRTAQRRLLHWKTYTSYNQNGRYYVLSNLPKFNENGIWKYKDIFFSKYGNLRKTLIALVNNSLSGLTISEMSNLVNVSMKSFMAHKRNVQQLRKVKIAGRFVYFSSDEAIRIRQVKNRQNEKEYPNLKILPVDAESIIILVEKIKFPTLSIEQLSIRLRKRGHRIRVEAIRNLFQHHGLEKKSMDTML
jgi:hypothetical protein